MWLKTNWKVPAILIKIYLLIAVVILMFITSMGIFGFLSKSYSDQKLKISQSQQELIVYDQELKVKQFELDSQLKRIDSAQASLDQLDKFISESISRTAEQTNSTAINSASRLRQSQRAERQSLNADIQEAENLILEIRREISNLELEKLPFSQNVEKVEAELGPVAYISKLIYQDSNSSQIDRSVTLIILLLVLVFDPLALILLLAGLHTLQSLSRSSDSEGVSKLDIPPATSDRVSDPTHLVHPTNEVNPLPENTDGPVIQNDGTKAWYVDGKKYYGQVPPNDVDSLYTQNEEQNISGIWTNLKNLISRSEYNTISEQKSQETLERLKRS